MYVDVITLLELLRVRDTVRPEVEEEDNARAEAPVTKVKGADASGEVRKREKYPDLLTAGFVGNQIVIRSWSR